MRIQSSLKGVLDVVDEKFSCEAVEAAIENYIKHGNKDVAVQLLHGLAIRYAEGGAFAKAEATRNRIFLVNPAALTEIITSAEIIDDLKHKAICPQHKEVWVDFYNRLSKDEATVLYFSLQKERVQINQVLFEQGNRNDKLFFIDQGCLKIIHHRDDGRDIFLGNYKMGDIAGGDTFCTPQLCTSTLIADTVVVAHVLDRDGFAHIIEEFPQLEQKLQKCCDATQSRFKKTSGSERRNYKRVSFAEKISIQMVNKVGQPQGMSFMGDIVDISVGGLALSIAALKRESSRLLLGRRLRLRFTVQLHASEFVFDQNALVTGITYPKTFGVVNEYTIHLSFDKNLDARVVAQLGRHQAGRLRYD